MNNNNNLYNNLNNETSIDIFNHILNCDKFYLLKDNTIIKIHIGHTKNEIILKYKNYISLFNINHISILFNISFNSIDLLYNFFLNKFYNNEVLIKDIEINNIINLIFKNENKKEIEINLKYNKDINYSKENIFKKEINNLKKEIKELKEENSLLKKDIEKLKKYHDQKNPKNYQLLSDLTEDSFADDNSDNSFTLFNSINNLLYIIYSNTKNSIVCYDLISQKKITEIKNAHSTFITNFRYYFDKINNRDIIMSLSCKDNNIRLWNFQNWECILNLKNINNEGDIYSACFYGEKNVNYVVTSNSNWEQICEPLKIYDFQGNKIKEINYSSDNTFFLDCFYDNDLSNYFFITGNFSYVKSYDYKNNQLYNLYNENDFKCHLSFIIQKSENIFKLIESSTDGNVRIWNFHTGILLTKIKVSNEYLRGICLLNNDYLLVSCDDQTIKIIELKTRFIVKSLLGHTDKVLTIKKINHPIYKECIISQGFQNDQIKLWINFMDIDTNNFIYKK